MRPYQVATAAVIILIAAVAMFDTRSGALPDPTGTAPGGLRGGWYPFWSAALMAGAAGVVMFRALRGSRSVSEEAVFASAEGVRHMLLLVVPMTIAIVSMAWLGFYIVAALYMAFFMRVVGRYGIPWVLVGAAVVSVGFFFVFEKGFLVPLPKSIFYGDNIPF